MAAWRVLPHWNTTFTRVTDREALHVVIQEAQLPQR